MSRRREKIDTGGGEALGNDAFAGMELRLDPSDPSDLKSEGPSAKGGERRAKGEGRRAKRPVRRVEVRREKAGRGGKTVTTLSEFPSNVPLRELEALCRDLKKSCACGGALKGRSMELQGDVRDRIEPMLRERGYAPVRAGG